MRRISSHENQLMNLGCRGHQSVDSWYSPQCAHAAPFIGHLGINWQDATAKVQGNSKKPELKTLGLGGISALGHFDAFSEFAQHKYAQTQIPLVDACKP